MRLTMFSDLALRVLMYTHAAGDRLVTIDEITSAYKVSRAHLNKVVNALTRAGYLKAVRGRSGGVKLGKPAEKIGIGNVIRATEPDFALVECFATGNRCVITKCCKLQDVLDDALQAFLATLDQHTLATIAIKPRDFMSPPLMPANPSADHAARKKVRLKRGAMRKRGA
jgi:Rrf2 family nitric oxide-sensitive transcriptional repressor